MLVRVIDLNCKEKEYEFNISAVSNDEWMQFTNEFVKQRGEKLNSLDIKGCKVVIRDNRVKIKLFYQDSKYHEVEIRLDVFGRVSQNYRDDVSKLWQGIMAKRYGEKYLNKLSYKMNIATV